MLNVQFIFPKIATIVVGDSQSFASAKSNGHAAFCKSRYRAGTEAGTNGLMRHSGFGYQELPSETLNKERY